MLCGMGRDVSTHAEFGGKTGAVRALLEAAGITLRGEIRARIPRDRLTGWQVDGDDLSLATADGPLLLTLGAAEAAAWCRALDKPLPGLAQKLGITPATRLWRMTPVTDETLTAALDGAPLATPATATLALAVILTDADLAGLVAAAAAHRGLPFWAVNEKGPHAALGENAIRTALRAAGLIDTKSCAVSDRLSATRYAARKA
jgi:hypothetical protein